jgi:hypothetical protein
MHGKRINISFFLTFFPIPFNFMYYIMLKLILLYNIIY